MGQKIIVLVKQKKSTRCGNFAPTPVYTLKEACLNFGTWGHVLDVINRAKFQLDRLRGFGAPGWPKIAISPLTGGIALTTVYALMCYTVIQHAYKESCLCGKFRKMQ